VVDVRHDEFDDQPPDNGLRPWRTVLFALAGAVVLFFAAASVFVYQHRRHVERLVRELPPPGDLLTTCAAPQNGAFALRDAQAKNRVDRKVSSEILPKYNRGGWARLSPADKETLRHHLGETTEVLLHLDDLAQRECFGIMSDLAEPSDRWTFPNFSGVSNLLTTQLLLRAHSEHEDGSTSAAQHHIYTALKVARQFASFPGFISVRSGELLLGRTMDPAREILSKYPTDPAHLRDLIASLDISYYREQLGKAYEIERRAIAEQIRAGQHLLHLSPSGGRTGSWRNWRLVLSAETQLIRYSTWLDTPHALEALRQESDLARMPYYQTHSLRKPTGPAAWSLRKWSWFAHMHDKPQGKLSSARNLAEVEFIRTALQCRLHKVETGRYPEGRKELVARNPDASFTNSLNGTEYDYSVSEAGTSFTLRSNLTISLPGGISSLPEELEWSESE